MESSRSDAEGGTAGPLVVLSLSRRRDEVRYSDAHHVRVRRRLIDYFGDSVVLREVFINASGRRAHTNGLTVAERMVAAGDIDVVVAEDCTRISRNAVIAARFVQRAISLGVGVHFLDA